MDCINHGMLPPFLDKLLLDCVVQLDQIEMLPCEICDKVFYGEENLMKHLITHIIVKNEDTESDTNICTDNNKSRHNQMVSNSDTVCNPGTIAKTIHIANATKPKPQNTSLSICNQMNSNSDDASSDQQANDINNGSHNKSVNWKEKKPTVVSSSHNCKEKDATEASTANKDPTPFHHTLATRPCVKKSYGKLYSCRICKEQFAHKSFLEKHELNHQEMVQVTCDDSSRSHQPQLKKDMGKEHTNPKECTDRQARTDRKKRTDRTAFTNTKACTKRKKCTEKKDCTERKKRTHRKACTERKIQTYRKEHRQEEIQYCCDICLKLFWRKGSLRYHIQTHILGKAYSCQFCKKAFMFADQLKKHIRIHTDERLYSCKICNIYFRNTSSVSHHNKKIHFPVQPIMKRPTCAICNKQYRIKARLLGHIYSEHIRTGYPCRICKKEFGHPVTRASHVKIWHNNNRNFKCKLCDKTFVYKYRLERHETLHDNNKPYKCDVCKKRYGRKDHLSYHIQHARCDKLKPFQCSKCEKRFSTGHYFRQHVKKC